MERSSEISGFYKQTIEERRRFIQEWAGLTDEEARSYDLPPASTPACSAG